MPSMTARKKDAASPWPERLRRFRTDRGLTQTDAAKLVGVDLRTWQRWEGGESSPSRTAALFIEHLEKAD